MVTDNHYRWDFIGLSTDEKPTPETSPKVVDGSTFYCSDNSKLYVYCKTQWYEKTATGGGGTTYTAGDGIAIADDTISVDLVQSTGSDTKKVMSQKSVTDALSSAVGVKTLTTDDYDYPENNPTAIALWNLDEGNYIIHSGVSAKINTTQSLTINSMIKSVYIQIIKDTTNSYTKIIAFHGGMSGGGYSVSGNPIVIDCVNNSTGASINNPLYALTTADINDTLTSASTTKALSANQGKVLNDKFGGMKLVSISQTDYDNLGTKHPDTLYIITGA